MSCVAELHNEETCFCDVTYSKIQVFFCFVLWALSGKMYTGMFLGINDKKKQKPSNILNICGTVTFTLSQSQGGSLTAF